MSRIRAPLGLEEVFTSRKPSHLLDSIREAVSATLFRPEGPSGVYRIIPGVAVAVQASCLGRALNQGVGLHEARQGRVVDAPVHVN